MTCGGPRRKKAIVTKKADKGDIVVKGDNIATRATPLSEYLAPGGVKKISNSVVSGRATGGQSYDPQANLNQRVKQKSDRFCMMT